MEQLRFVPVAMFLVGMTLIYAGFTGQRPLDIVRGNLGGLANDGTARPTTLPFTENANPYYVGTTNYQRPSMSPGPRLFTS